MIKKGGILFRRCCATLLTITMLGMIPAGKAHAVNANGAIARGIDVSMHNGTINWGQVANAGIQFTFIKVGSTKSGVDPQFAANITGAQAAGLKTGIYLYSYATTPEQAAEEARLVLEWINPYTVNYPIVYDIEDKCHKNLSDQQMIDIINAFCIAIDEAGYYPMVYSYKNMFLGKLSIAGWDKWVAQYADSCEYNNNVCFWQYSSHGSVSGVSGRVDVNYQYKDYSSLIIPEGFVEHNGSVRFYRNWRMQKGWNEYNGTKYYLDGAGNLVRGWFTDASGNYYLTPADGSIARGQYQVDGADLYFTAEGVQTTGWVTIGEAKYFYDPANNGIMKREWYSDAQGMRYYFDPGDGHMAAGWFSAADQTYYADGEGHIVTGICEIDGQPYYFDASGALVRGQALELNGTAYQTTAEGVLVETPSEPAAGEEAAVQ